MLPFRNAISTPEKFSSARRRFLWLLTAALAASSVTHAAEPAPPVLDAMSSELNRAFQQLGHQSAASSEHAKSLPPYFLSYSVHDTEIALIGAQYGALTSSMASHSRSADVVARVGSPQLDNTHGNHRASAVHTVRLPLGKDRQALTRALWTATDDSYGNALDNYLRVKTEAEVRAKEEDASPDFSQEKPQVHIEAPAGALTLDKAAWERRIVALSRLLRGFPDIYANQAYLAAQSGTDYFVSSEGASIVAPHRSIGVVVLAMTRAEDGMDLVLSCNFQADSPDKLPSQTEMEKQVRAMGEQLEALRKAPVTEPFSGPAILSGRAAAVFFHEVLGHRLEGQRQRGDQEGQTFTKELGKSVLPDFLSVADDPTLTSFGKEPLNGTYAYDSEGIPAERVPLIDNGILKTFLMSRLPIASFAHSNGHGRAQSGRMPTGRQGNLIVSSTSQVSDAVLRQRLIDEAKRQGKSYGLYFEDISSGFAVTQRNSPQAFQVIPLVVKRIYVDGRPDELVRGVSIVGTPLAAMKKILVTGDRQALFNGVCGAESGSVPVSAIAPAMLLSEIETQRQPKGTARPPILPIPGADSPKEAQ